MDKLVRITELSCDEVQVWSLWLEGAPSFVFDLAQLHFENSIHHDDFQELLRNFNRAKQRGLLGGLLVPLHGGVKRKSSNQHEATCKIKKGNVRL